MRHDPRRTAAHGARLLLLSYLAAGCSVSHHSSPAGLWSLGTPPLPSARVHLVGSTTTYDLRDVTLQPDSLVGYEVTTGARRAFVESSVETVETRSFSPGRTAGLVGAILLGTIAVLTAIAQASLAKNF